MKIQAFFFIAALLLFTAFVRDIDGALGWSNPGRRKLERKVCIFNIKESLKHDGSLSYKQTKPKSRGPLITRLGE